MAKKTLTATLSVSSIQQLQKDLEKYRDSLTYKARLLVEKLSERGVEIARVQVADLDAIFTGELIQSLHSEYKGSTPYGAIFAVVADSSHAIYVEMGTGMVGAERPYPGKLPAVYAQGKTIRQATEDIVVHGSVFVKAGEYFWTYIGDDGKAHITKGMPSRPFLYNTAMELRNMKLIEEVAKDVFGK